MVEMLRYRTEGLWFDVERRYKTIYTEKKEMSRWLWFDVERRYKTIVEIVRYSGQELWFDVERRYKTIGQNTSTDTSSCGLL